MTNVEPDRNKTALIFEKLSKVMGEITAVGKTQQNKAQNYSFRGIDEIYDVVHPAMVKHGVSLTYKVADLTQTEITSQNKARGFHTVVNVEYIFWATDGTYASVFTRGESMSYDDKGFNKALQAALKYALIQMFLIPVAEPETDHMDPQPAVTTQEWASKYELDYLGNISKGMSTRSKEAAAAKKEELGIDFSKGVPKEKFDELLEFVEDLIENQTDEPWGIDPSDEMENNDD